MGDGKSKQFQNCPYCGQMVVYKTDYCRLCRKQRETGALVTPEQVAGPDAPPPQEEVQFKDTVKTLGLWCLIVGLAWFGLGMRNWHGGISSKLFTGVFLICCGTSLLLKWSPRHVCYVILALLLVEGGMCLRILLLPLSMIMERGFSMLVLYLAALPVSILLVYLHLVMKVMEVLDDLTRLEWKKQRTKPDVVAMSDIKKSRDSSSSV